MKTKILLMMAMLMVVSGGRLKATHHLIEDGDFFSTLALIDDTLLMTGGTGELITMSGLSIATIENTSPLSDVPGEGGIWDIHVSSTSILNINGGEINNVETAWEGIVNMDGGRLVSLEMHAESQAFLWGGQIENLASDQTANIIPNPLYMINLYSEDYAYSETENLLTGYWLDNSPFSINLIDIGDIPTFDYINFVPEPATVLLLGIGGLILRKRVNG